MQVSFKKKKKECKGDFQKGVASTLDLQGKQGSLITME